MSDRHKDSSTLATAALMEIISQAQSLQGAILRKASREEVEAQRGAAHDMLDVYLDHTVSAATHVRAILKD